MYRNTPVLRIAWVVTILSFFHCTFEQEDPTPLSMSRIDGGKDTLSLWPRLVFRFSTPLMDSFVPLFIQPDPGPVYFTEFNKRHDTLILTCTGSLSGNSLYTISIKNPVHAPGNKVLAPEAVSFRFYTFPGENEPNNTMPTADTLSTCILGTIFPARDTDCYFHPCPIPRGMYVKNYRSKAGFSVVDTAGTMKFICKDIIELKTLLFSDTLKPPLYIKVFSIVDNNVKYELGTVQ